jgi:hypothetical protein
MKLGINGSKAVLVFTILLSAPVGLVVSARAQDPYSGLWTGPDIWKLSGGGYSGTISFECTLLFVGNETSPLGGFLDYTVSELLTCTAINLPPQITTTAVVGDQYSETYDGTLLLGTITLLPPGDALGLDSADKAPSGSPSSPTTMTLTDTSMANSVTTVETMDLAYAEEPVITLEPSSVAVDPGASTSFMVEAGGVSSYQWYLNGTAIPNATGPVLDVSDVQESSVGAYTVGLTNNYGTVVSSPAELTLDLSAPVFLSQPTSQTMESGSTVVFTAAADAQAEAAYQWYLNGNAIALATSPQLVINGATEANAGTYTCKASNSIGSLLSASATLAISTTSNPGRLVNLSCRADSQAGGSQLIAGYEIGGQGTKGSLQVLVRASGPALTGFGVTGVLPDPQLTLDQSVNGVNTQVALNAGWGGTQELVEAAASVGAFAWSSASSKDSALYENLSGGAYTAQVTGVSNDSGVALAEVYDATPSGSYTLSSPRLTNISARVEVGTGGNILIAGFEISGTTSKTVLIRASGPVLADFGLTGVLPDPGLSLYQSNSDGTNTLLQTNTGWGGNTQIATTAALVGAFSWGLSATPDSAILVTLPPGGYTAEVDGASGDTGIALVEVYEVP